MKLQISNGTLTWTIESTDGIREQDFVTVIKSASMSTVKFIEMYYDYYAEMKDHRQAYERMEKLHENLLGSRKYSDYNVFKTAKSQFMNKPKK